MAIGTYTELQTEIGNWLSRSDLTNQLPEYIQLAEAKMNRDLRTVDQETKSTSFSINAEYVNVPTSFLAVKSFQASYGGRRYSLRHLVDEEQTDRYNDTGVPMFYSVVGQQFRFAPIPNGTYTATLIYYITIPPLASNATNWLLSAHPDVYLAGSMLMAATQVQMPADQVMLWKGAYDEAIATIKRSNNRNRYAGPGLVQVPG